MDERLRQQVRAAFERQQAALSTTRETRARLLSGALARDRQRLQVWPRLGAAFAVLVGALSALTLVITGLAHFPSNRPPARSGIEQALSSGNPASVSPNSHAYVWFTSAILQAPGSSGSARDVVGTHVYVLDWSGALRHQFNVPKSTTRFPQVIQSIAPDGTRALLSDGTVLDETGGAVGRVPTLANPPGGDSSVRWSTDDRDICASFSNEPTAPNAAMPTKSPEQTAPVPKPAYALPNADHSVTLKLFDLRGGSRTIATFGRGAIGPSGTFPDSTSVLTCNPSSDLAIVARYHDADARPNELSSNNMTVSVWTLKLSTGALLSHTAETRMALGRAFFFGSENGRLAVEFLWNSKVAGSETDVVLQMPSGAAVPVLDSEPIPDTPAVSADGTRILRRLVQSSSTVLEIIDADNGHIIRRVVIPASVGALAVPEPGGSSFMVQVDRYVALLDGNGGITLLHPPFPAGVSLPPQPGLQG